jgi:hypothetical protein
MLPIAKTFDQISTSQAMSVQQDGYFQQLNAALRTGQKYLA